MKLLFCCKCGDIRSFDTSYTSCNCGNSHAKWIDPQAGTVMCLAIDPKWVRIIGLNNSFLRHAMEQARNGTGVDFSHEKWREFHALATVAPGYLFDAKFRNCWAIIFAVGHADGVVWDPKQTFDADGPSDKPTSG